MGDERLKFLGKRGELEMEKKALEIRIQALIKNLRDDLNPLIPVEDLRPDAIAELSAELGKARERYREVVAALKQIKEIIG
jgi:low affinity Fe/Cu permease